MTDYSIEFLQDENTVRHLLSDIGEMNELVLEAITGIGELCLIDNIVRQLISAHEFGQKFSPRFDVQLSIHPQRYSTDIEMDLLKSLEDSNVIVPKSKDNYRVMFSNLMNRLFTLTETKHLGSIRNLISGLSNSGPIELVLDTIEWELVKCVHETVDIVYLDIPLLKEIMIPNLLVTTFEAAQLLANRIIETGGVFDGSEKKIIKSFTGLRKGRTSVNLLKEYLHSLVDLAAVVEGEANRQRMVISSVSVYPRSFLGRGTEPLFRCSLSRSPNFRYHPLIAKFQQIICKNHEILTQLADKYEDYIRETIWAINQLPRAVDTLTYLKGHVDGLPDINTLKDAWALIDRHLKAINVQAQIIEGLVESMDTLFVKLEEDEGSRTYS